MKIQELINRNPEGLAIVSLSDLREFAEQLIDNVKQSVVMPQLAVQAEEDISYSTEQVVQILNVDKSTLWRWKNMGYLLPYKIGNKNFYSKADVDAILHKK